MSYAIDIVVIISGVEGAGGDFGAVDGPLMMPAALPTRTKFTPGSQPGSISTRRSVTPDASTRARRGQLTPDPHQSDRGNKALLRPRFWPLRGISQESLLLDIGFFEFLNNAWGHSNALLRASVAA